MRREVWEEYLIENPIGHVGRNIKSNLYEEISDRLESPVYPILTVAIAGIMVEELRNG